MDKISQIVATSISQNVDNVNRISANTQNVTTIGFKGLIANQKPSEQSRVNDSVRIDSAQGELRQTNRSLDLAIQGRGWFILRKGEQVVLSRNGQIHIDANGYLVDANGFRLQGSGGDMQVDNAHVQIGRDGVIRHQDQNVDQILLASIEGLDTANYQMGHFYFERSPKIHLIGDSHIFQGYLEQSNVNPSGEVVELMNASRHIQTMQQSLSAYDRVLKKTLSELGK